VTTIPDTLGDSSQGTDALEGFDDKIISMYARGMTTREIRGHLEEMYGIGGFADTDLQRDRWGDGGGQSLAGSAAGTAISHRVLRRAAGEGRFPSTGALDDSGRIVDIS
jgi:hypothetical protein